MKPGRRDALVVASVALAARLAVVAWAAGRFAPTGDATYYDKLARRLAAGEGYTWLWPDGAVTYAAHYPVGYPAALAALYATVSSSPTAGMLLNAVVGTLAAVAAHRLAARCAPAKTAFVAGLLVALHPGLVFYTPALMTEAVTGALLAAAAALAARARDRDRVASGALAIGIVAGLATLVRPQALLCAPTFAALAFAPSSWKRVGLAAALASATAIAVCAPWTARNCVRMHRCALVSVNGGWNLLIGTDGSANGAWAPVDVPPACREVWDEAGKDACFERAAVETIAAHPASWLALAPGKLAATFDYSGAPGWYLHASNPDAFGDTAKVALGVVETLYERVALLLALVWAAREDGSPRRRGRVAVAVVGAVAALVTQPAWIGYVAAGRRPRSCAEKRSSADLSLATAAPRSRCSASPSRPTRSSSGAAATPWWRFR